jgi:hypothetical protein
MSSPPPTKYEIREQLDADVAAFLGKGGKITEIDQGKTRQKAGFGNKFLTNTVKAKGKSGRAHRCSGST